MNPLLQIFLAGIAVTIFAWGFERYRTRFVKKDFIVAIIFSIGLGSVALVPGVYDWFGQLLNLQQRFVVISLLGNLALLGGLLYLLSGLQETRRKLAEMNRNLSINQAALTDGGPKKLISPVIPAYNEEDAIQDVIKSLPKEICGYTVEPIVVSDGSGDMTAQRADIDGTTVVEHPVNQGQGGALQTGFGIAQRNGVDIVVTMDGDGQHPADELERLVKPIIDDEADFVMGSRYQGEDYSGNGIVREAGIRCFTWMINFLSKANVTDCTNGYRAISGDEIDRLTLTEERFSAPELIIEARKNGLRIREIPITIKERTSGESKKPQLGYAFGLTRTILTTWIR